MHNSGNPVDFALQVIEAVGLSVIGAAYGNCVLLQVRLADPSS